MKYFLSIPYDERENTKSQGAKWDANTKLWYVLDSNSPLLETYQLITLQVDYKDKDEAKALGAKYNNILKSWYCTPDKQTLIDKFH